MLVNGDKVLKIKFDKLKTYSLIDMSHFYTIKVGIGEYEMESIYGFLDPNVEKSNTEVACELFSFPYGMSDDIVKDIHGLIVFLFERISDFMLDDSEFYLCLDDEFIGEFYNTGGIKFNELEG